MDAPSDEHQISYPATPTINDSKLAVAIELMSSTDMIAKIHALKQLQLKTTQLDAKFHKMILEMEEKFQVEHDKIFRERCNIVNGNINDKDSLDMTQSLVEIRETLKNATEPLKGMPGFWLSVLKRVPGSLVKSWDEPVLQVSPCFVHQIRLSKVSITAMTVPVRR